MSNDIWKIPSSFACLLPPAACFSRSEENFHDTLPARSLHSMHTSGKRILFADQTIDVDGAFFQEIKRRLEPPATRAQNSDLINNKTRSIKLSSTRPLECRLQHEYAAWAQQLQRAGEA